MSAQAPVETDLRAAVGAPTAAVASLDHVTKRFDDSVAVADLTLTVPPGQIFGLIGPSGCGKSTVIRLLVGALTPTEGTVRVMGHDPSRLTPTQRAHIGYTPQGFFLYPTLTALENLNFVAGLFGMPCWRRGRRQRIREVLEFLELWPARHRLTRDLSGGMQRRLELACALVHWPSVLFVDEPTAGLDPILRQKIWEELRYLSGQGTTVFVTTQYIDEAVYCDTVAVLAHGRLRAVAAPAELQQRAMRQMAGHRAIVDVEAEALTREDVRALLGLPSVHSVLRVLHAGGLRLIVDDVAAATVEIIQELQSRGVTVASVNPYEPTFDDVFMRIVEEDRGSR